MSSPAATPVILIILDGWGIPQDNRSILRTTEIPTIDKISRYYPMVALQASGISVGLPWGEAGNSEVGHITLGSGRIVYQSLPRISLAIQDESFFANPALVGAVEHAKKNASAFHIMALLSSGAVHSHYDHIMALVELARRSGLTRVFIHPFTDGRDSAPTSGVGVMQRLVDDLRKTGIGTVADLSGRHWAMDRNNNWDRTAKAWAMLHGADGVPRTTDPVAALEGSYNAGTTDEYVEPTVVTGADGVPVGPIRDNDAVVFANFREDRARQLAKAFALSTFDEFDRGQEAGRNVYFATMTEYEKDIPAPAAFPPEKIEHTLGEILSAAGKHQLRIAETEKYAHVTYFFNGGAEAPFPGEDRILIPSPSVSRFDEAPEMSAAKVTETVIAKLDENLYDFILINYANADMVGHTGNEAASREAVRAIDKTLSLLLPAALAHGARILITADHGNVEVLYNDKTGAINTEHSTNPVPLWYITPTNHFPTPRGEMTQSKVVGLLSDIAPTVLDILGLAAPRDMQGQSMLPLLR